MNWRAHTTAQRVSRLTQHSSDWRFGVADTDVATAWQGHGRWATVARGYMGWCASVEKRRDVTWWWVPNHDCHSCDTSPSVALRHFVRHVSAIFAQLFVYEKPMIFVKLLRRKKRQGLTVDSNCAYATMQSDCSDPSLQACVVKSSHAISSGTPNPKSVCTKPLVVANHRNHAYATTRHIVDLKQT